MELLQQKTMFQASLNVGLGQNSFVSAPQAGGANRFARLHRLVRFRGAQLPFLAGPHARLRFRLPQHADPIIVLFALDLLRCVCRAHSLRLGAIETSTHHLRLILEIHMRALTVFPECHRHLLAPQGHDLIYRNRLRLHYLGARVT